MTIVSNSSALFPAPGASGSKANSMTDMGADDFLTLMVAQLQHQDPTKPMDNTEFVAQLAQFTNLEESQKTNKNLEELLTLQRLTQAGSLAGREVEFLGAEGRAETGRIDSVIVEGDAIGLSVDGRRLSPGSLIRIMANSEDASSAAALEEN